MNYELLLSSVVRALVLPPFIFFVLVAFGWLVARSRPRLGRTIIAATLIVAFVLSTISGANLLVRPLESMTKPLDPARTAAAQAIVVPAAGSVRYAPEYGRADVPDHLSLARLRYAARLQHQTKLPILVSGGIVAPGGNGRPLAAGLASALREDFRTPVEWVEDRSTNTFGNARESAKILLPGGRSHILLVTDAMDMPRASEQFERAGFDVIEAPTMFMTAHAPGLLDFLPSVEGLRRSRHALYEWIGLAWYRARYP
jgi:uncharacterized SAM-binding protein YcdF (DUF218 family)